MIMITTKIVKIKFDSDGELSIKKAIEIPTITIVDRAIFLENKKCYTQVFSD